MGEQGRWDTYAEPAPTATFQQPPRVPAAEPTDAELAAAARGASPAAPAAPRPVVTPARRRWAAAALAAGLGVVGASVAGIVHEVGGMHRHVQALSEGRAELHLSDGDQRSIYTRDGGVLVEDCQVAGPKGGPVTLTPGSFTASGGAGQTVEVGSFRVTADGHYSVTCREGAHTFVAETVGPGFTWGILGCTAGGFLAIGGPMLPLALPGRRRHDQVTIARPDLR